MKLTPWFPGAVKPVRVGVYKRVYDRTEYSPSDFGYCYWNGHVWSWKATTPTGALSLRNTRSPYQEFPWRGVLFDNGEPIGHREPQHSPAALAQRAESLTIERLRDALVASRIIPPAAVEDPDEYDDGVTLYRIEALHRRIT